MTFDEKPRVKDIYHYGVKGMKWGIRRYQPYPSGSKRQGRYLGDSVGARPLKYKSKVGDAVKQFGVLTVRQLVASVVPGAALIMNAQAINNVAKQTLDGRDYTKKDGDFEKISQMRKKNSQTPPLQDAKATNPGNQAGRVNNCGYCTAAYEMRRRGYDVEARRKATGVSTSQYSDWFEDVSYQRSSLPRESGESRKSWVVKNYDKLCSDIEKLPNGSRGFCSFNYEKMTSGHTISWEIQNGQVIFYDAQSGNTNVDKCLSFSDQNYVWARLDDRKLRDGISETCVSKKR